MGMLLAILAIAAFMFAAPIMEHLPRFGYLLTWPMRLALPITGYSATGDSVEGVIWGLGLAFIMSFENSICWKIGVALLIGPSLWHTGA